MPRPARALLRALLLALALLLAGCAAPGTRPIPMDPGSCDVPQAEVDAVVSGTGAPLVEVTLVAERALRAQLSCVGPPPSETLPAVSPDAARGGVFPRTYEEARVRTEASVARLALDAPIEGNGTLRLDLGESPPAARWNGTPLDVRAWERFDDPRALDATEARWEEETRGTTVRRVPFTVNSSWNRGAWAEAALTLAGEDRALAEEPERAAGARVELRVVDDEGRAVAWRNATRLFQSVTLLTGPLEPGAYALEVRATPADDAAFPVGHRVAFVFAY